MKYLYLLVILLMMPLVVNAQQGAYMPSNKDDGMRLYHVRVIVTALDLYYKSNNLRYPESIKSGEAIRLGNKVFLQSVPRNPGRGDQEYRYVPCANGFSYQLYYSLEGPIEDYVAGPKIATPQSFDSKNFSCPSNVEAMVKRGTYGINNKEMRQRAVVMIIILLIICAIIDYLRRVSNHKYSED